MFMYLSLPQLGKVDFAKQKTDEVSKKSLVRVTDRRILCSYIL